MTNKLFLTCPFSRADDLIKSIYGPKCFILHALAAVFNFDEINYKRAFKAFVDRESIGEITIVHDRRCRFLSNVVSKKTGYGYPAEAKLRGILEQNRDHFPEEMKLKEKVKTLSILHMKQLAIELKTTQIRSYPLISDIVDINGMFIDINQTKKIDVGVKTASEID